MKKKPLIKPPALADKLLRWHCKNAKIEDLEGDLEELFSIHLSRMPIWKAKVSYYINVVSLIFSYAMRSRKKESRYHIFSVSALNPAMLKNYFVIGTRNLSRHKFFTVINILGLAIGMSIGLLFISMMSFLWSYDDFHVNRDSIYRITSTLDDGTRKQKFASAPSKLAEQLTDNYTGVGNVVRIDAALSGNVRYQEREIALKGFFVDPGFFDVFTFPLLQGSKTNALRESRNLVITQAAAEKLFGNQDAVGKVIEVNPYGEFQITGLLQDHPKNSHIHFEILASYQTLLDFKRVAEDKEENEWTSFRDSYVYLVLPEKDTPEKVQTFLSAISKKVYAREPHVKVSFKLQALEAISPGEDLSNPVGPAWNYLSLGIFALLTLMILLPACFNYANIAISRALKRMKEMALRKVMGGQRDQIFFQFITETVIICLISLALSIWIFDVIREEFLTVVVESSALQLDLNLATLGYFILFAVLTGLVAGSLPALYFARLTPVQALQKKPVSGGLKNFSFRKILVVSQFAISLGFIMGVVIVVNQYRFAVNFDVGFTKENILDVQLQDADPQIFKTEASRLATVSTVSLSSKVLGTGVQEKTFIKSSSLLDSAEVVRMSVDEMFVPNFGLTLLAGENFSPGARGLIIVNEEFLKVFQLSDPAAAINEHFFLADGRQARVIGVVKNFHYSHIMEPVKSFFFEYDPQNFRVANVKISSHDVFKSVSEIENVWKAVATGGKFDAKFFEDEIEQTYSGYYSMLKICGFLSFLAISISCLGLLGMVVFTVENRVREISIRKVFGASELSVIVLLSWTFLRLMLIAAVIAIPFTWLFFENSFLRQYHYKIEIGIGEVAISLALLVGIGLTTILSQTIRAARANPVDTLKNE